MLFGASYYPEYQPYDRLDADVRMMVEAGINFARLGDSIWALCEPVEGRFDVEWLKRILDTLHEGGIRVVLCTPTFAIPAWLHRRHPEVMSDFGNGVRTRYGGRQNVDISHPTYRFYAERIIRVLVGRYASHPAIVGYQVDNETGSGLVQNEGVFDAFVEHLRDKFRSVDRLNEVWGLNYWSHRLETWADLWRPAAAVPTVVGSAGNTNPCYDLEWRRFHASLTTEFLRWQTEIVKQYARADQFVTQDMVGGHGKETANRFQIGKVVDVSAENLQHATQDALALPAVGAPPLGGDASLRMGLGPAGLYFKADMGYGGARKNFLVTEINPISVGGPFNTYPEYNGQWRLAAYAAMSRGADAISYWHWHSTHYGKETYSHGILNHDLEANRCYDEIALIGRELAEHGDLLTGLRPHVDVGFLYSPDSRYALEFQPCLRSPGGGGLARCYPRLFDRFYRGFFAARAQAAIYGPGQPFEEVPVLVVPALYIAPTDQLERLVTYAENGGHLVLTFRSGYADEYGRARWERAPGALREAVGASYNLYSHLDYELPLRPADGELNLSTEARASGWADELQLEGATPLAYYEHPHFGQFPAVTTRRFGRGRVTYVGTWPNETMARDLAIWVMQESSIEPLGTTLVDSVRVTRALAKSGQTLCFMSNWSFQPQTFSPPVSGWNLFTGEAINSTDMVSLKPWDVTVVVEG